MDTKLKKFNSTLVLKVTALLLCLSCVANFASRAIDTIYKIDEGRIREQSYRDAFYEMFQVNKEVTDTETFRYHMGNYSEALSSMLGRFGDGSEEAYELWKKSIATSNDVCYKKYKENITGHIIADEFRLYLNLVKAGVVVPLGLLTATEYSGNSVTLYTEHIDEREVDYSYLCKHSADTVVRYTNDEAIKEKAKKLGADGIFELNNYYEIMEYDDLSEEETIIESYKPGYYAFKIDEAAFKDVLVKYGIFAADNYGSAAEFGKAHKMYADTIKTEYPSGRYFIRDASGRVYTNVKGLGEKSSNDDIEKKFASLGFYCQVREYGDMFLPDGAYYTQGGFNDSDYYYENEYAVHDYETTTIVFHTNPVVTTFVDGAEVTAPAVPEKTTAHIDAYDATPFVNEDNGNWYCLLGVDMSPETFVETDLLRTSMIQIENAKEVLTEALQNIAVTGSLFLICFIYLIARSGRRKGDSEIHLLKTDAIFTDWRIAIDLLLGWCVCGLFFFTCDEFYDYENRVFSIISCLLAVALAGLVIDLVLFITRHIKARTLFKNIFFIWLIRKGWNSYKNKIKPVADEKLLYTKSFAKGTVIRIVAVVCVNLILSFFGAIEAVNTETLFFFALLALFDAVVFIWFIRLIGGLQKIFSALEEIRQGNYDVQINTYVLPATLRESAGKVMSLRDGLKTAVDEAVKQEQTKTELITNVSHDLKTPLTSIINYVELLKKCNINDEDAIEYLGVLGEKSDRLKKLIEDLVEASKASTGNVKVELMQVSLNEMVSQLLGEHADGLERKQLNVVCEMSEENFTVKADGKLLYRVMENLIVNVEKYSLYGTRVYVTVKREGNQGTVTFKNISEKPLNITADQLKERFVRGDESRSTEGNGLGLSIAESLCNVQGGELEININGDLFTAKVKLKR